MFDTQVLDKAIQRQRAERERERISMLDRTAATLIAARSRFGIREAYVIGSLLFAHRWCQTSDVDVAVSGCPAHTLALMKALEEATGCDVDVVDLDTHPFAESFRRQGKRILSMRWRYPMQNGR